MRDSMLYLGYFAFILMGLSLGVLGGGGSILTVPILVYVLKIEPLLATEYSLFVVGCTALVGGMVQYRRREVDLRSGIIFAIPSFAGVLVARSIILPRLPEEILRWEGMHISKSLLIMTAFAILMLTAATTMIFRGKTESKTPAPSKSNRLMPLAIKGVAVGMVTGFIGAGGGFLIIPALVILIGMPMRVAVGTSLFIIAANSLLGFTTGFFTHHSAVDWTFLLTVTGIALIGISIGVRLLPYIPEAIIKRSFGIFTLAMGSFILIDQISKI